MQIVQNMRLSELETAALRLAIAEGNPLIASAMERFRIDMDETDLVDSLRAAAKSTIHRMILSSRNMPDINNNDDESDGEEDDDDEEEEDEDDEDYEDGDDEHEEDEPNAPLNSYAENKHQEEEENDEDDEDEDEEDDENFNGSSLITSQAARDQVFPILVNELVKENIISNGAGKIIMQQFTSGNPVISTALDIYDQENDMAQLVDTLQQLVENLQSN